MRAIVPIHQLERRMPEQGRIRCGIKGQKGQPVKLKRFRFTSTDLDALKVVAEKYGGEVAPWTDAKAAPESFQVTVTERKIPVALPPNPIDVIYELWSGGGCVRRCDGIDCTLQKAADARPDAEPAVVPCMCRANEAMACKPKTRLRVILREVPFAGTWRLESNGWHSARELPGMVDALLVLQQRGISSGYIEIQERQSEQGRRKFIVPAIGFPESLEAIARGAAQLGALAAAQTHSLPALEGPRDPEDAAFEEYQRAQSGDTGDWFDDEAPAGEDDEIADAEIVDEPPPEPEPPKRKSSLSPQLRALHAAIHDVVSLAEVTCSVDEFRHALVAAITKGRESSSKKLTDPEMRVALDVVADLLSGERGYLGIAEDGRLRVSRAKSEAAKE